ncbi:hypothetical protein ADEAN_000738000 [Angomonas deanei]|uniref:SPRY domain containing protein n=1 Tax=Angomonas deanei TaxID=59799 RepID=A0A7G2CLD5_9TRYP|nr:hypothetical protein ADEAN_000738000 [Angomonas deanei]
MNIPQNKWHTILLSKIKIYNERTQTYYKTGAGGRRVLLPEEERYQHQASHEGEGLFLAQGRIPLYFRYEVLPEEDNNEENENNNNNKGMAVFGFVELSQSAQYEIRKNEQLHLQNNNNENNNNNNDDVDEEIESWFTANVNAVLEKENGPLYAEHNDNTNHFNKKQSTGGVYVGDLPDSYGYRSDGMLCSGDGSYLLGPSLQHHDILSLIFCLEEDYVEVGINGSRVGTMGTDIFSEGQVYVPAVSLRGAGVTLLPYRLTDREEE